MLYGSAMLAFGADSSSLKLFDLSGPQLRSSVSDRPAPTTNAPAPVEELVLQTKVAVPVDLLVQRHAAMNGTALLTPRPAMRDASRFQRALDSFLPAKGALFQKNPNTLSSPLQMSEHWAK